MCKQLKIHLQGTVVGLQLYLLVCNTALNMGLQICIIIKKKRQVVLDYCAHLSIEGEHDEVKVAAVCDGVKLTHLQAVIQPREDVH